MVALLLSIVLLTALPLSAGADAIEDSYNERWGKLGGWRPASDWESNMGMPGDFPGEAYEWSSYWSDYQAYRDRSIFTPSGIDMGDLQTATIGNIKSWVNLRGGPSTDAEIIGKLNLGTTVSIDNWSIDGEWAHVIYNNYTQSAWVYGQYIIP